MQALFNILIKRILKDSDLFSKGYLMTLDINELEKLADAIKYAKTLY